MADIAVQAALQILVPIADATTSLFDDQQSDLQPDLYSIKGTLNLLKAFLDDSEKADQRTRVTEMYQSSIAQIRDLSYRIEDVVEEFKLHLPCHFHQHKLTRFAHDMRYKIGHRSALSELSSRIKMIKGELEEFSKLMKDLSAHFRSNATNQGPTTSRLLSKMGTVCHGLREGDTVAAALTSIKESIVKELLSGELQLFTLSIEGPSGSGKTVLAWDVYEDQRVQEQFKLRAWVSVSSSLDKKELLRSIASQFWRDHPIEELSSHHEVAHIRQLRDKLKRDLKDKRYLVVLDNVQTERDLSSLKDALPSGLQGSRIIVTSGSSVASACFRGSSRVHRLEGWPWKDSWNLFCEHAFGSDEGECPDELEDWATKLVKKCEGQPRALITVASELSKKPMRPAEWKAFHDTLGRNYSLMTKLWPSFGDLSIRSDLKSCFFYFSVFPEDYSINAGKLKRLWIAEGFFDGFLETDRDRIADEYLAELVGLNLVHVSMTDLDGRPKNCRVLNLVREFIIAKAEEQNFIGVISTRSSSASTRKARRLSLTADGTKNFPKENAEHVRSAFLYGKESSFNLVTFKLMRILEMKGAPLRSFPEEILKLSLLRYLSLRHTQIREIPRAIKKLSLLETLDLKDTLIKELPRSICKLQNLQNLLVYRKDFGNHVPFDRREGVVMSDGVGDLVYLKKLSLIKVDRKIIKELSKLVNLRKLGIVGLKQRDVKELCESVQKMQDLASLYIEADPGEAYLDLEGMPGGFNNTLEVLHGLHLKGRLEKLPKWTYALKSVIKISLRQSMLAYSPLEALKDLPNLMELELIEAYTGDSLVFAKSSFKKLKVLTIEGLDKLNAVVVQQEAMPSLERLKICKCWRMVTPPQGIRNLGNLTKLVVADMHREFHDRIWDENYTNILIVWK